MRYAGSRHETASGTGTVDIRQLDYFIVVAQAGEFHQGGRRAFLSRQALSKAVRNLEHELGQPLLANRDNHLELTDAAVKVGARAIVIKTHQGTTMDRAYLCNRYNKIVHGDKDFTMFGSITLNHPVGGLNPAALEVALKLGAKVVWLPTQHAQNHLAKFGKNPDDGVKVTENGKICSRDEGHLPAGQGL